MKKILSLILLTAILCSVFACTAPNVPAEDTTTAAETTETITSSFETTEIPVPQLPDTDMDNRTIHILSAGWWDYKPLAVTDIVAESMTGEIMNDTVYTRMTSVMEKYSCIIEQVDDAKGLDCVTKVNAAVMSDENAYDLAVLRSRDYYALLTGGLLTDLNTVPHLSLDAPYYDSRSLHELEFGGKHYGVLSNISMNPYLLIFCAYFNKVMADNYALEDPYALVQDGKWTVDKMYEMCCAVAEDLDHNGVRDQYDRYGAVYVGDIVGGFLSASGVRFSEKRDGKIIPTYNSEESMNRIQDLYKFFEDTDRTFCISRITTGDTSVREVGMFIEGQTLFSLAGIYYAPQFRDMKDDYGILPLPKYNEEQEEYYSPLFPNVFPLTVIPRSNHEMEYAGIILEELSYLGYTELLPALYDTILTGRCARDANSVEMLDIIFGNVTLDISMVFDFGGLSSKLLTMFITQDDAFASTFASIGPVIQSDIDKLLTAVSALE